MNEKRRRISAQQLAEIRKKITPREQKILTVLHAAKFMTSAQIKRLFFAHYASEISKVRESNRTTNKLEKLGLIEKFSRNIGGASGGSEMGIWRLSAGGLRFMNASKTRKNETKSTLFLEHLLMITETFVRMRTLETADEISELKVQFEPNCWRGFSRNLESKTLRPDLFAKFVNKGYEENYFFELDRETESLPRIIAKCKTYVSYYNTGIEQRTNGVFPLVVWFVPTEKRAEKIAKIIHEHLPRAENLFQVVEFRELERLICGEYNEQ